MPSVQTASISVSSGWGQLKPGMWGVCGSTPVWWQGWRKSLEGRILTHVETVMAQAVFYTPTFLWNLGCCCTDVCFLHLFLLACIFRDLAVRFCKGASLILVFCFMASTSLFSHFTREQLYYCTRTHLPLTLPLNVWLLPFKKNEVLYRGRKLRSDTQSMVLETAALGYRRSSKMHLSFHTQEECSFTLVSMKTRGGGGELALFHCSLLLGKMWAGDTYYSMMSWGWKGWKCGDSIARAHTSKFWAQQKGWREKTLYRLRPHY